jgi:hypothetical protein
MARQGTKNEAVTAVEDPLRRFDSPCGIVRDTVYIYAVPFRVTIHYGG